MREEVSGGRVRTVACLQVRILDCSGEGCATVDDTVNVKLVYGPLVHNSLHFVQGAVEAGSVEFQGEFVPL